MAKFFRKIRFDLVGKGSTSKYLKYAIGEIVLVVVGILIAIQINNANQNSNDNKALAEYLVKVKSHTQENSRRLDTIIKYRSQLATLCKKTRISILDKTEDENLILFMSCGAAFADYYFKPNVSGYESLKNSKYFGKINNTKLDSLLTSYHSLVQGIAENEKSYNDYVLDQEAHIATQLDMSLILASAFLPQDSLALRATPQSEYFEDYLVYTSSIPFRNVISLAAFQIDAMVLQYGQLKDIGQGVVAEINVLTSE